MKIIVKLIFGFLFLISFLTSGQNYLLIQKKKDSGTTKKLSFDNLYTIKTKDTIYVSTIVNSNDSTLTILKDGPNWRSDKIQISKCDIQYLKKDSFKNRKWLDPFSWTIIGGGIGVLFAQEVNSGFDSKTVGYGFVGGILCVTVPVILFGTSKAKFDMNTKWSFAKL